MSAFDTFLGQVKNLLPETLVQLLKDLSTGNPDRAFAAGRSVFGDGINQTRFEADGTIVREGNATGYVDVNFRIVTRTAVSGQPTPATLVGNLTAPRWAVNDYYVCTGEEYIHDAKQGADAFWHIHAYVTGDATPTYMAWEVEYSWANSGVSLSEAIILQSGDVLIPANTPANTLMQVPIGVFQHPEIEIMAHIKPRLKRVASVGAAPSSNPFCEMLQLHVECDTVGSRLPTAK